MGVTLLSDMARRLVDEDEPITNELLVAARQSLENLANKGLMSVTIMHQSDDLADSLVVYQIEKTMVEAFQNGNLSIATLTKSIN